MENYSVYLPAYTIGTNAFEQAPTICQAYGTRAVIVGGETAMAVMQERLTATFAETALEILGWRWYGGEASFENVATLAADPLFQEADMIFAIGGGKAIDAGKTLGDQLGLAVFAFPTIASTCAATTAVSIMYHPDGTFRAPYFLPRPPVHTFIDIGIMANAPTKYLWAGMGDTYAKYYESSISGRDEALPHYVALGIATSQMCVTPILTYGAQALGDNGLGIVSEALTQTVLAIIVTTGLASNLLTQEQIIDYNTGLAHAIFYALTTYPHIEEHHFHGEVVGFGVLVLLLVDGQEEAFNQVYAFNKSVGLPICAADLDLSEEQLTNLIPLVLAAKDIDHNPYAITADQLASAFTTLAALQA